jgi:hypothetical protein
VERTGIEPATFLVANQDSTLNQSRYFVGFRGQPIVAAGFCNRKHARSLQGETDPKLTQTDPMSAIATADVPAKIGRDST